MKHKLPFLLMFTYLSIVTAHAQSFECRVESEIFSPSDTSFYFDVKLYATGATTTWEYATGVFNINMNSAFRNSGTITATIVAGSSELNAVQVPTSVTYNATNNYVTIAAKTPPGAGAGTIITQAGLRLIRMRLKNTVAFSKTAAPNLAFRWATPNTNITAYVGSVNTPIANNTVTTGQKNCKTPNYWNGISWNKGLPLDTTDATIFTGTYKGSLKVRSLVISPNGTYNLVDTMSFQFYKSLTTHIGSTFNNTPIFFNIENSGRVTNSSGSIISNGLGLYYFAKGSNQRFIFKPDSGYVVDSVVVNGIKVDSIAAYTFYNINSAISLKVVFKTGKSFLNISNSHPQSGFLNTNSSNNIIAGFQLNDSLNYSILSALGFTTQGNYTSADIQSLGFKCWINSTNDLVGATQIGSGQAVVTTGGIINFSSLNQIIPIGISYILVTCDISNMASNGNTIGLASTPLTNFIFSGNTTVIGSSTLPASNLFTINEMGPVKMKYTANNLYKEDFSDIANWTNGFLSGLGVGRWTAVTTNAGTIPNATSITVSSANFQTSSSSAGIQRGSLTGNVAGTLAFLTLGNSDNTSSCAVDFSMDFSKRNADSLIFDAATVFNGVGNRVSTLRVYWSIDGVNFTEITGVNLPYVGTNNVANSSTIRAKLPSAFNNISTCRLRYYYHNGTGGTSSSRPKISIDNVQVSAVCPIVTSTSNINSCTPYTWNGQTYNSSGVYSKTFSGSSVWGCDSIATLNLSINSISSFNPFQDTIKACGTAYTLNAGNGYSSYLWNTGATSTTISPSNAGKYKVTVSYGTCSATDSVLLSLVSANIINNDTIINSGSSVLLKSVGSGVIQNPLTYLWSNGASTQNFTVSPTQNTNYFVTVNNGLTSCKDSVKIGVNVKINLKMYFEALYENGRLKSSLNNADGISSMEFCDTVQIQLFDSVNNVIAFSVKTLVDTAGICQIYIPSNMSNNKYYLIVKHRGSIETWSNSPVLISNGITYNFTNSVSKAFGDNLKNDGYGVFLIYSGDINQDGFVDGNDFIDVDNDNTNFVSGYTDTDVNGDGFVDGNDFILIDNNNSNFIGIVRP